MKKTYIIALAFWGIIANAQVTTNGSTAADLFDTNYFLDASLFNNKSDKSIGKLLGFPQTDLKTFEFNLDVIANDVTSSAFDGVVVYNTASGKSGANPDTQGIQVDIEPGFYYFYNPRGVETQSVSEGKWIKIGGGNANSKVVLATNGTAVDTNTVIGSTTVKAIKNTITHTGGNSILVDKPAGFTKLYSIKIYKVDGTTTTLVGTNLYSYADEGADKLKLVFGNGIISTSYPKGEYEYVLEYL